MNQNVLFNRPVIKGWELRQGCDAFAHAACSALGLQPITLRWSGAVSTASINRHGLITVANVADDARITRATLLRYCGFIIHELLHRKHTEWANHFDVDDLYLRGLHNACEDAWIEHSAIDAALLGNVEEVLTVLVDQIVSEALASFNDWSDPKQYPFLLAIWLRRHAKTKISLPNGLAPIFDAAAAKVLTCTSTADTFKLAKWVYAQLNKLPPPDNSGNDGKGDKGDEQGNGPQNAPDGPESDDQGQGKGEGAGDGKNASAPSAGQEPCEVEPTCQAPDGTAAGGVWTKQHRVREDLYHVSEFPRWSTAAAVPAKLRYEVRQLFEDTATTMISPNRKSGAINVRALHRYGQSDALFHLRRDIDGIDSAVVVLLDVSSSMFDDSLMEPAVGTASALIDTLEAAGVNTCVMTFGDVVSVAAGFDIRAAKKRNILSRIGSGGSTNDFSALRHAHDILRVRPEQRKLVFVITDGEGNRSATLAQGEAGKAFGITTVGVGIMRDVSRSYAQSVKVTSVAELGQTSFKQIKLAA